MKIAVVGLGYVGLSLAVLLSQNNEVVALDIVKEKVDDVNTLKSGIEDNAVEPFLRIICLKYFFKPISFRFRNFCDILF